MPKNHRVLAGECIASIAYRHGFHPDTLWDAPANAKLKQLREGPNVLLAGDIVVIPDKRVRSESAEVEKLHRFRRKGVPEVLRLRLVDDEGEPRKQVSYTLTIDGKTTHGETDSDGRLSAGILPNAKEGLLTVGQGPLAELFPLALGRLDPVDTLRGVQQRLNNLGWECGAEDGVLGEELGEVLRRFQDRHGLSMTGEADDETCSKLMELNEA